jgi:glucose dehydrogenase
VQQSFKVRSLLTGLHHKPSQQATMASSASGAAQTAVLHAGEIAGSAGLSKVDTPAQAATATSKAQAAAAAAAAAPGGRPSYTAKASAQRLSTLDKLLSQQGMAQVRTAFTGPPAACLPLIIINSDVLPSRKPPIQQRLLL